jgi:hypothetical protein
MQGILTEVEGSVQLNSSLRLFVCKRFYGIFTIVPNRLNVIAAHRKVNMAN